MKGRVAFHPSPTFALRGAPLPVGPWHVKAQGGRLIGCGPQIKMWWKSDFPYALFLRQTPLRSLTEEKGGKQLPQRHLASQKFFFLFLSLSLSFRCVYDVMFFPVCLQVKILPYKTCAHRSPRVQRYNNIWTSVTVPRPL